MSAQYPVVPVAAGTLVRVLAELMLPVVKVLKTVERALRHRREANVLARLDRHMLADIGLTRSDVQDAFSSPLWEDPTELLSERARERRIGRLTVRHFGTPVSGNENFSQPAHRRALPLL